MFLFIEHVLNAPHLSKVDIIEELSSFGEMIQDLTDVDDNFIEDKTERLEPLRGRLLRSGGQYRLVATCKLSILSPSLGPFLSLP